MITITKEEFYHWNNEISRTHNIFEREELNTGKITYFITTPDGDIPVLSKYTNGLGKTFYYKNENVIGEGE